MVYESEGSRRGCGEQVDKVNVSRIGVGQTSVSVLVPRVMGGDYPGGLLKHQPQNVYQLIKKTSLSLNVFSHRKLDHHASSGEKFSLVDRAVSVS